MTVYGILVDIWWDVTSPGELDVNLTTNLEHPHGIDSQLYCTEFTIRMLLYLYRGEYVRDVQHCLSTLLSRFQVTPAAPSLPVKIIEGDGYT